MSARVLFVFASAVLVVGVLLPSVAARDEDPLPAPTGPYQVGATFRQWIDASREEPFTASSNDKRILSAWIYYPADVEKSAERTPYVADEIIIPTIRFFVVNVFGHDFETTFAALSQWKSYAYRDAPVSNGQQTYPVILFTSPDGLPLGRSLQAI